MKNKRSSTVFDQLFVKNQIIIDDNDIVYEFIKNIMQFLLK